MSAFFGSDGSFVLQFAIIFLVILAVLTAIVLVVRRFSGRGLSLSSKGTPRGRQPRLGIVDVYELDRQRQLILLRRDNVEHLLLVGGPNDVVIERHIQRGLRAGADPILRTEPLPEAQPESLDEPALETPEIAARRAEQPRFEPDFPIPLVVPPAAPEPSAPAPAPDGAMSDAEPRRAQAEDAPEPPRRAEAAPKRPLSRSTPPLINPRPDVASERARTEPSFADALAAKPVVTPPQPPLPPSPVTAPAEPRAVDAGILSDMARQLEIALARPASAVTPPPGATQAARPVPGPTPPTPPAASAPPTPPRPAPSFEPPRPAARTSPAPAEPATDPMAAAMAASQTSVPAAGQAEAAAVAPPVITPAPEPKPVVTAPPKPFLPQPPAAPAPGPQAQTPAPAPPVGASPAQAAPPAPAQAPSSSTKPAPNPFSVEEIEAEFARLLGRPLDKKG
ncbi:hypothetical protein [Methylobacterium planeticum]|uniref:Flagellar biosynthesis protein FliO n=1 Tax=Methylobacterium planeticum TaxID=2615211 RepID=A0A6N6MXK9_9HYPH|nr:hypothetical protein [Methylobacterium planeticum]KAB1076189.1 hypothetical protein F6X51_01210 [Methylobacterium planeticum]